MVEPSTHDINVMINDEWRFEDDKRGVAYVTGLEEFIGEIRFIYFHVFLRIGKMVIYMV